MTRFRYALVGVGSRAQMYLDAIAGDHADVAELVAWSDPNPGRLDWSLARVPALGDPARFDASDLADVVRDRRIDRVIVTSPDFTHAGYLLSLIHI